MMSNPLVSIIVPCYKQGDFLSETLDSVYAQTYSNWECIVVNDGSPDNTAELADIYCKKDARFKYLYQENSGLSAARNAGIANTSGDFILPLDADDLIAEDYVKQAIEYFENHPSCKLVYCKARKFGYCNEYWDLKEYNYDSLLWNNYIFCSAVYKRKDYIATGGYNSNMIYGYEDWDFWLSLLKDSDEVYRIDSEMFFYRTKLKSMLTTAKSHQLEAERTIVRNHPELYNKYCDDIISIMRSRNTLRNRLNAIEASVSYRVGRAIVAPVGKIISWLKSLFA